MFSTLLHKYYSKYTGKTLFFCVRYDKAKRKVWIVALAPIRDLSKIEYGEHFLKRFQTIAYLFVVLEEINVTVPVGSTLAKLRLRRIEKGKIQAQGREVKTQNVAN